MNKKRLKLRLDVYLVDHSFVESREKAKALIMEGKIYVNDQKEDKPGTMIWEDAKVECKGQKLKYVSRGGLKLEKAMHKFDISFEGKMCIDIGSSTGGFTDLMLQNGAQLVYAVDSGTNQLDYKLRTNDRVKVLENTNARYLTKDLLDNYEFDIATIDVSFISLKKILPAVTTIIKDDGNVMMLIKPQFEAGREKVEKNGVIRDANTHIDVIKDIINFLEIVNLYFAGLDYSPIKGPAGNIEFLLYATKRKLENINYSIDTVLKIVEDAHKELDKL